MSTPRSSEEKRRIEDEAIRLDKEGGDVLGFLHRENYMSPGATWWRIQRDRLHRSPENMTSGKPKIEQEDKKHMSTREKTRIRRNPEELQEVTDTAFNIAMRGIDPEAYLKSKGYKQPRQAWMKMKKDNPERALRLPQVLKKPGAEKAPTACQPAKPSGVSVEQMDAPKEEKKPVDRITAENRKVIDKMMEESRKDPNRTPVSDDWLREEKPKTRRVPALATLKGIEDEMNRHIRVAAVSGTHGTYSIDGDKILFSQYEENDHDEPGELAMKPEDWTSFLTESIFALEKLGAIKRVRADEDTGD